ncbi:MAG: 4-hydroxythreonine-4-phosphate dehydrogenase PdxA [Deltaproteobacteria bacterium RIFCSPLOWO2_12_55_13]|nr:MAG: 4-hydroxythreonine-4-phosphate dehydrogenase PdxA [Deltaproteobacteria bacterium RIFCSPLOWO2_12_55_13]
MAKPIVAVTMGDPAGVGPEVILKALAHPAVRKACRPLVLGDWEVLNRTRRGRAHYPKLVLWERGKTISKNTGAIPVLGLSSLSGQQSRPGHPSKACGEAAYRYIKAATELVLTGVADAMATAPISKRVLQLAGHRYPGHTELLAELTHAQEVRMMLMGGGLRVVLVTVHLPLVRVARELTRRRIRVTLELAHRALRKYFGISRPRLAVAAFNPHAGEEGIFGQEEKKVILPAVREAKRRGIQAHGPLPADSLFYQAARGDYDAVVCMYHDQGLIPLKLLHFFGGVALTLGLPIIRTSVDHGTAYDIAGKGRADGTSMREAILLAARLARRKKMWRKA